MTAGTDTPTSNIELSGRVYGVELGWIGEDSDMIAHGHVEPRRFIAAANRWSRESSGFGLRETAAFIGSYEGYRDALTAVKHAWAVRLPKCDCLPQNLNDGRCQRTDHDDDPHPEMWAIRWDGVTKDTLGAFPVTLGLWS